MAEPPAPALAWLVAAVGPVAAAARVRAGAVPESVARETAARRVVDRVDDDLGAARACGGRLLTPEDPAWPHWASTALENAADGRRPAPKHQITTAGRARRGTVGATGRGAAAGAERGLCGATWCRRSRCGSVGRARSTNSAIRPSRSSAPGRRPDTACTWRASSAPGWRRAGFTVVSGAAIGVDGAAHRGALAAAGPTVAVLACGIDRSYPAAHEALLDRIAATGLVVSEYPPGSVPARHRFLVRNRLIAGLAAGTVVVEAGFRSGAQRTAADARALGRPVMAVPGPVTSGRSAGCHRMIREGAVLVTRVEEVLEEVGRLGLHLADAPPPRRTAHRRPQRARRPVHDALPARAAQEGLARHRGRRAAQRRSGGAGRAGAPGAGRERRRPLAATDASGLGVMPPRPAARRTRRTLRTASPGCTVTPRGAK